jgi:hypothetical protein
MPKQTSSALGEYLKYGAETKRKGFLKITKINPLSVRGDVVYPVGEAQQGDNVLIDYTCTYKTELVDLIVIDSEAPSQIAISSGSKEKPVLTDIDEQVPSQPVPTVTAMPAVTTPAEIAATVPQPDEPISERLQELKQATFDTEERWTETRNETRISWLATDALMDAAYMASE